jgi:hypothetical protein
MPEEGIENITPKTEASKSKKPKLKLNKWMIGLILLVLVLGGLGMYQFKKNKDLQAKLDKKEESKAPNIEDKVEDSTDAAVEDKTVHDPTNTPT